MSESQLEFIGMLPLINGNQISAVPRISTCAVRRESLPSVQDDQSTYWFTQLKLSDRHPT